MQDVGFLKMRASIVWAMSAALDIVKSTDGMRNKNIESLKGVLKDWEDLEKEIRNANYSSIKQVNVTHQTSTIQLSSIFHHFNIFVLSFPSFLPYVPEFSMLYHLTINVSPFHHNSLCSFSNFFICVLSLIVIPSKFSKFFLHIS